MKKNKYVIRSTLQNTSKLVMGMLFTVCACSFALAEVVTVGNPWARATVQGQKGAGVFMTLTSPVDTRLIAALSPVAAFGEVHEMRMDGDVMKMRALKDGLEIPAGKTVELKPGSFHVMLMDLKGPLLKDTTIPLTLVFVNAKGVESKAELTVPVNAVSHMHMPPASN